MGLRVGPVDRHWVKEPGRLPELLDRISPTVDGLVQRGAEVVWLAGSHARGEATRHSDVDLGVIAKRGAGPGYRLERADGLLLSISWTTAEDTRRSFSNPALLGAAVPGWRRAVLVYDPSSIGAELRDEARRFDWSTVAKECDRWAAEQVTGYGEEVHKLASAIERRDRLAVAVQRNVLAMRLAFVLSVRRRILYDSENALWSLVTKEMGEPWASEQAAALALSAEPLEVSSRAALRLYVIAASEVASLLDARQRLVVDHAVELGARFLSRQDEPR